MRVWSGCNLFKVRQNMVGCCAHGHETPSFIKEVADFFLAVVFPKEAANKRTYSKAVNMVLSL
jgi:hypothetical protein